MEKNLNIDSQSEGMEIEESSCVDKYQVVESENMDVDEVVSINDVSIDPSITQPLISKASNMCKEDVALLVEVCISKFLDVNWAKHCEGTLKIPKTAKFYKQLMEDENYNMDDLNYEEFISQILIEVIMQFFNGTLDDYRPSETSKSLVVKMPTRQPNINPDAPGTSAAIGIIVNEATFANATDIYNIHFPNMTLESYHKQEHAGMNYLIICLKRCKLNMLKHNEDTRDSPTQIKNDIIGKIHKQITQYIYLLASGILKFPNPAKYDWTPLLHFIYEEDFPTELFNSFLLCNDYKRLFSILLDNICVDMRNKVIGKKIDTSPLRLLDELLSIRSSNGNMPLCNLLIEKASFNPSRCTNIAGREISKVTYLAPFLSISVFADENPKLMESLFKNETGIPESIKNAGFYQMVNKLILHICL